MYLSIIEWIFAVARFSWHEPRCCIIPEILPTKRELIRKKLSRSLDSANQRTAARYRATIAGDWQVHNRKVGHARNGSHGQARNRNRFIIISFGLSSLAGCVSLFTDRTVEIFAPNKEQDVIESLVLVESVRSILASRVTRADHFSSILGTAVARFIRSVRGGSRHSSSLINSFLPEK